MSVVKAGQKSVIKSVRKRSNGHNTQGSHMKFFFYTTFFLKREGGEEKGGKGELKREGGKARKF